MVTGSQTLVALLSLNLLLLLFLGTFGKPVVTCFFDIVLQALWQLPRKATALLKITSNLISSLLAKKLILNNFTFVNELFLFISTAKKVNTQVCHVGFFITNANYNIVIAGCCPLDSYNCLDAELLALSLALQTTTNDSISIRRIFISNSDIYRFYKLLWNHLIL